MRLIEHAVVLCSLMTLVFQFGCGGVGTDPSVGAARVVSLSPSAVKAGNSSFTLVVNGVNFSDSSVILLNGSPQPTTVVSPQELTTGISATNVTHASVQSISVENVSRGGTSNSVSLTVCNPLQLATTQLPYAASGTSYSASMSITGGLAPFRWLVSSGALPGGLVMDSQTGAISGTPGSTGSFAFTAWVTDSMNSGAMSDLSINVIAAGTSGFYGSGLGSDGIANTTLGPNGDTVSLRFRAKNSGPVQQARIYLIPDHPGYAAGTGGTILATVNTDDGTPAHNPSSTVLASSTISDVLSLPSPDRNFYLMKFSNPPVLKAGQLYHVVFTNVDDSPNENFLSINALYQIVVPRPVQPTMNDTDAAVLLKDNAGVWKPRGFTPIYELDFPHGVSEGIGYMEGWIGASRTISGTTAVREVFSVSGSSVKVSSISIRVARVNGNDPLEVRLENEDGSLIEQGNVQAASVPLSDPDSPSYSWTTYTFSTPYVLKSGSSYHLDFEATATSTYLAFPIRKGDSYGFSNTTFYQDGHAEFEQDGSWFGWTQWGKPDRLDGDLQFFFAAAQ